MVSMKNINNNNNNNIGIYHETTVQMQNFSTGGVVKARRRHDYSNMTVLNKIP